MPAEAERAFTAELQEKFHPPQPVRAIFPAPCAGRLGVVQAPSPMSFRKRLAYFLLSLARRSRARRSSAPLSSSRMASAFGSVGRQSSIRACRGDRSGGGAFSAPSHDPQAARYPSRGAADEVDLQASPPGRRSQYSRLDLSPAPAPSPFARRSNSFGQYSRSAPAGYRAQARLASPGSIAPGRFPLRRMSISRSRARRRLFISAVWF